MSLVHVRISWKKESESVKLINSGGAHTIVAIVGLGGALVVTVVTRFRK